MKQSILLTLSLLCITFAIQAQKFTHPGILHTKQKMELIRYSISQKLEPAYAFWLLLEKNDCSQADYKIQGPFRVISRDGTFCYTKGKMEADFSAAYLNSIMWFLTNDKDHAKKLLEILSAYADSLKFIPSTNDTPYLLLNENTINLHLFL